MLASRNELVDLRRQRAGQRLMRPSPQPAGADFTEWQVCPENPEAPPSAPMNAYQVLETKITEAEGKLTKLRSRLVSREALRGHAQRLELGQFLMMGRGEEASGGRQRTSTLADAFEALLGAIYLDTNLETARQRSKKAASA